MKYKVLIDSVGYKAKPEGFEAGTITNRILFDLEKHTRLVNIDELAAEIEAGKTIITGVMSGNKTDKELYDKKKHFSQAQLFLVDIDNDTKRNGIKYVSENPADIETIREICHKYKIQPALIYESFSSRKHDPDGKEFKKYHILFASDEPVTDSNIADDISKSLAIMFSGYYDENTKDVCRILFGTCKDTPSRIIHKSSLVNTVSALASAYYDKLSLEASEPAPEPLRTSYTSSEQNEFNADVALEYISSDTDRNTWLKLSSAYKNCGGSFSMWETWCKSGNYDGKEPLLKVWNSLSKPDASESTLISYIQQAYPDADKILYECYHNGNKFEDKETWMQKQDWYKPKDEYIREKRMQEQNQKTKEMPSVAPDQEQNQHQQRDFSAFLLSNLHQGYLKAQQTNKKRFETGFLEFDKILDGGLTDELYCITGGTGVGKTTLFYNIAENIARKYGDKINVLYFALEMTSNQLISRGVSRLSIEDAELENVPYRKITAAEYDEHLQAFTYSNPDEYRKQTEKYFQIYGDKLYIIGEESGLCDMAAILQAVRNITEATGKPPIVFIDYLQYLRAVDDKLSDTEKLKQDVIYMKKIRTEFSAPVLFISSKSRNNNTKADVATSKDDIELIKQSLYDVQTAKGSADIEYTAGVVINVIAGEENKRYAGVAKTE